MDHNKAEQRQAEDEPPPWGRNWASVYWGVLVYLFTLIVVLGFITWYLKR